MPIYEYRCEVCEGQFERLFLSLSRIPAEILCPTCQSPQTQRLISSPAIHKSGEKGERAAAVDPAPTKAVFGRKELNEAMENKRKLRESVMYGED
jgi:putative FmdB family regulatory protein